MRLLTTLGLISTIACRTDKSITIQNPDPKADIVSHDNADTVLEGMPTRFIGSVTDSNHTPDQLTTIWYLDGEIVCDDVIPDENGETECELALGLNNTEITLAVRDSENARGDDTVVVSVEPTEAPTVQLLRPTADGVYYADQLITFEGLLSDAEDSPEDLDAFWESNIDGVLSSVDSVPNSTGQVLGYGNLSEGQHAVELHVEDTTGKEAVETVIIDVGPPNSAPLCEIVTPPDGSAGPEGDVVTFTGLTSDVDVSSDWLAVTWSSDKDGELGSVTPDSSGNIIFSYADLTVNTHTISLQVADEVGATCTALTTFTVGTPPSVSIDSPSDGAVVSEGDIVSFIATVSDAQDQSDEVALDWVMNGISISTQGATSSGTATFSDSALTFGSYNLVATATDTDGLTDSDQINFTINGVPSTPVVSIDPTTPVTSDALNVVLQTPSVDPEGVTPTYTYEWLLGGQVQTAYTSSYLPSSATSKGEQWTVNVIPSDGLTTGLAATDSVVIQNTPPVVNSISLNPSTISATTYYISCYPISSDPDGDIVTHTYEWYIDGVLQAGEVYNTLLQSWIPGTEVTCQATPNDGTDDGIHAEVSVVVDNTPPVVDSVTLSPSPVYTDDTVTAVVILSDADVSQASSLTANYEWFVEGASVQNGPSSTLSGVSHFNRDEQVYVTVTPNDGIIDGAAVSSNPVLVSNTPPAISSVVVTPDPAAAGTDDLTCEVVASDADGDPIVYSYGWSDSVGVQQTTIQVPDTSDVFLAAGVTPDMWICTVTPYDGTEYGSSGSASTNASPSCSSLYFNGADTQVSVPTNPLLDIDVFTAMFWVYLDSSSVNGGHLLVKGDNSTNEWSITYSPTTFNFNRQGLYSAMSTTSNFIPDEWHHVAVSYDGSLAKMYIDGQEEASTNFSFTPSPTPLVIGNIGSCTSCAMFGYMRDVAFFDQVLTATEIVDVVSFTQHPTQWSSLVGFWSLSEGAGSIATEGSTSGLNAPIVSGSWGETCPDEDFDGDGYASWEDCDDTDPAVWGSGSGGTAACPANSCKSILDDGFSVGDGTYWIDPVNAGAFEVYCDMTHDGGGWTQLVESDFTVDSCPTGWPRSLSLPSVCSREAWTGNDHIRSTVIDSFGIAYSEVRGYLMGYQYHSADGFGDFPPNDLNLAYVDGLSITNSPNGSREHLFTYAMGFGTSGFDDSNCPGVNGGQSPQSFVGSDYHCESGNTTGNGPGSQWFTNHPIYGSTWFKASSTTTDVGVELRLMASGNSSDEDLGVQELTIQIR